ncbi:uncharacterized protein [Temnothorax longispinosus]|uniref:uncharacterized protein n=1 Tax=Temnothorax longispinosus TaxID=300112 RepID=UPI003A9A3293
MQATAAELVYGQTLRLPGQFLSRRTTDDGDDAADFAGELRRQFEELRPIDGARHGERKPFVFRDLATAEHVFVRHDGPRAMLQAPYDGPYAVVNRGEKVFVVRMHGKEISISVDRLKPAYILAEESSELPRPVERETANQGAKDDVPKQTERTSCLRKHGERTRSGRRVRFPSHFQAGL